MLLCAFSVLLTACGGNDEAAIGASTADGVETLAPAERGEDGGESAATILRDGLAPPFGLVVTSTTDETIVLEWDGAQDATGYRVLRVASGGLTDQFEVSEPTFSDTDLEEGDVFSYRIVALDDATESEPTEPVTARVGLDESPPSRPGRPEVLDTATGQSLTWTPSVDESGIDGYVLTRVLDGVSEDIVIDGDAGYRDDVEPGRVVTYSVRAIDGVGNVSDSSRNTTLLTGTTSDRVIIVVSAQSAASNTTETLRLQTELLDAGFTISWFEDNAFDSNIATSDDTVLLLGDVEGDGFDWNLFGNQATVIGLKSTFIEAAGFLESAPKLDRVAQVSYSPPGEEQRFITVSVLAEPKPIVYLPPTEQLPDLEVWATPSFSAENAIAGLLPEGAELANGRLAPGCRAFYPGNTDSFSESTSAGWDLLIEFVSSIEAAC